MLGFSSSSNSFLVYLLRFFLSFCILYFGTRAIIGLAAPGGYYLEFVAKYLDYISWLRNSLLFGSKQFLFLLGYKSYILNTYSIRLIGGRGVRIVYSCIGYGVMSFWGAFVFANKGSWIKKLKWSIGGWIIIWIINVARISLLVLAVNKGSKLSIFHLDHHTLFNIAAYIAIFILIYFFDRFGKEEQMLNRQSNEVGEKK